MGERNYKVFRVVDGREVYIRSFKTHLGASQFSAEQEVKKGYRYIIRNGLNNDYEKQIRSFCKESSYADEILNLYDKVKHKYTGKRPSSILSGISYIFFKKINRKVTQEDVGNHFNCSSVCVRNTYRSLINDDDVQEWWDNYAE